MFKITETTPVANAQDILVTTGELSFTFNDDIDTASISDWVVSVGIADSSPFSTVAGRVQLSDTNIMVFIPEQELDYETRYVVIITGGSYGVKSLTGRRLSEDYIFHFESESVPVGEEPVDDPVDGIPMDTSADTLTPVSFSTTGGKLALYYAEDVDPETTVVVKSKHPLGRPGGIDLWFDNHNVVISGNAIIISSSADIGVSYKDRLVVAGTDTLSETSIPIIEYEELHDDDADPQDFLRCTFDFAVNRNYTVYATVPEHQQFSKEVLVYLAPLFMTIEEAQYHLKSLKNVYESDEELGIALHMESQQALRLWQCTMPDPVPYYVQEYLRVRLLRRTIDLYDLREVSGGAAESISLGDFSIGLSDPSSTGQKADLEAAAKQLRDLEYILSRKLTKCDTDDTPIYQPTYALMAQHPNDGVIASVPSRGRVDPTYDDTFNRTL